MKLRRSPPTANRQRLRHEEDSRPQSSYSYRSNRSEVADKVGRQTQRQILQAAGQSAWRFWLQRFGVIILLIAVIASGVNILTLSADANIQPLSNTQGAFLRDEAVYQQATDAMLRKSFWNRNKLTIDTSQISRQLLSQFPELVSVTVTMPLLAHRPLVYIQPAQPALILTNDNGAFLLDTTGKALLKAPDIASLKQPHLPVVADHSNLLIRLNHQALPASSVQFVHDVVAQLATKQYNVASMSLPAAASELDVQLAEQAYMVKFNLEGRDSRQQAGTFIATINQLQSQHATPAKYIDVRVDGRAYYQ